LTISDILSDLCTTVVLNLIASLQNMKAAIAHLSRAVAGRFMQESTAALSFVGAALI
jgi:hypothetical protein